MSAEHVFLVPGFFGFANLGELRYFGHVHRALQSRFEEAGRACILHDVKTRPTASLHHRAGTLADAILASTTTGDRVHIIGHSSGGLDARVLLAPGTALGDRDLDAITDRTASLITVSTPHRGTPAAAAFGSMAGRPLLRLLSTMTIVVLRRGQLPLKAAMAIARLLRSAEQSFDADRGMLDELQSTLLGELTPERTEAVRAFFADVGSDQALLDQITPEAMELFNATTPNAPGVRYGSVVTRARRPNLASIAEVGLRPSAQASHALHFACHRMARWDRGADWLSGEQRTALRAQWPKLGDEDNDAMVPTSSQPWAKVIHTADADHLDIIGHFAQPDADPAHYDWIRTGTGFRRAQFDRVWDDVYDFMS